MTLRELVEKICAKESWKQSAVGGGWDLVIPQPKGRTQTVRAVGFRDGEASMVRFVSIVGGREKLDEIRCRTALELNSKMVHGCLALDGDNLVVTTTRPLGTTTPETSAEAIRYIARQADTYERLIYSTDQH